MQENSAVYIHVGLHKTGTTFLQEAVFPQLKGITFFRGWAGLRGICKKYKGLPILISDEGYSGNPRGEDYLGEFERNVAHIQSFFNHPAIIIGFRSHSSFLLSLYKQYLQEGGYGTLDEFFNTGGSSIIQPDSLFFQPRIEICKKVFGRVFIYTQEDLAANPVENYTLLADFMGSSLDMDKVKKNSANVGVNTEKQLSTLRLLNKLSDQINKKTPLPTFYNSWFRKLKITPRNIAQDYMRSFDSPKFLLPDSIQEVCSANYEADWQYVLQHKSAISK